jgi:5-methylcytosine-specific restriction endonuclease McrA
MSERLCQVEGCGRKHCANGYCSTHNARVKRTGEPGGPVLNPPEAQRGRTCAAPDCPKEAKKRSFCYAHYERWKTHGKLEGVYSVPHDCSEPDCPELAVKGGRCAPHAAAKLSAYHRDYYLKNRDKELAAAAVRQSADKQKYRDYHRAWYQKNKAKKYAQNRAWLQENPSARAAYDARRKLHATIGMDDFDLQLSRAYREAINGDPCFYCGGPGEHVDHYTSLANGGTDHWFNLVRACATCNKRKGRKNGDEFLGTLGLGVFPEQELK